MKLQGSLLSIFLLLVLFACRQNTKESISFNQHIRPILNEKCLPCHGGIKAMGNFSLLFEEEAFAKTESGKAAIVRGNHQKSELYQRLIHKDPEQRMPFEKEALSPKEIDHLAKWIDQGAKWEKHWAYIAPSTTIPVPDLKYSSKLQQTAKNNIDNFLFDRLYTMGLDPNNSADSVDLIRRLYLDLIGLLPSEFQVDEFLNDTSPEAYEQVVNNLLDSPHFGERWASMWLDLARYADTKGYEKDSNRNIWKFRDWVINAFNKDMPFDQFTIEQLAGDLLENPTASQLIATAYHRNSIANDEGGTDDEEFRIASSIERVGNTYEVWMGTTFACVQCHSHPYDPFKHEEFYNSMAYFNNSVDSDLYNERPKLYSYEPIDSPRVMEILEWLESDSGFDKPLIHTVSLHQQKEDLLKAMGYVVIEAEEFDKTSPLIELSAPELNMIWQVQDSSWVLYEDVELTNVEKIGIRVATALQNAGRITVHLDKINGEKIADLKITKTADWPSWQWTAPTKDKLFKWFDTKIPNIEGKHDLYFRFWMGDTFIQHLFYVDKIQYHIAGIPPLKTAVQEKINKLESIPVTTVPIFQDRPTNKKRPTHFLNRGSWLSPEHEVGRQLPKTLSDELGFQAENRLDFAKAIVHPKNPITARVIVNRFLGTNLWIWISRIYGRIWLTGF